jgi:hypothetical protein
MEDQNVYLKPNAVIEPLWDQWYAWPHLISPATAAMNLVGRHLKIMSSFIMSPKVHEYAVVNPKMRGGPFMDISASRVDEVKQLKADTQDKRALQIQFVGAIHELNQLLKEEGKGYSLEELYTKVPEILKGYVELVYDLNNNPSYRFFEALLYKSDLYAEDAQSIAMWITNNDERPFVLSTPRMKKEKRHAPFIYPF